MARRHALQGLSSAILVLATFATSPAAEPVAPPTADPQRLEADCYKQTRERQFPEALAAARSLADVCRERFGPDHWRTVDARLNVTLVERLSKLSADQWQQFLRADEVHRAAVKLQQSGKYAEALEKAAKALPMYTELLGPESSVRLTCLANVVMVQLELGKYFDALPNLKELQATQVRLKGALHPDTVRSAMLWGRMNEAVGSLDHAEDAYRHVAALTREIAGPHHPDTVIAWVAVAKMCSERRKFAEAEPILTDALKFQREALGPQRPETAQTMKILGAMYCDQGKFAEAEPLLLESVKILGKTVGEANLGTAGAHNALGKLYLRMGRYPQAHENLIKSVRICQQVVGDLHPATAKASDPVAELYEATADLGRARQIRHYCLRIAQTSYGEINLLTADALEKLARTHANMNDYYQAAGYLTRAREIRSKLLGDDDPKTAALVGQLGFVYLSVDEPLQAEPLFVQALATVEKGGGRDSLEAANMCRWLGLAYQNLGKLPEAGRHGRRARAILEKHHGADSLAVAEADVDLAKTSQLLGDPHAAALLMTKVLRTYERFYPRDDPHWIYPLGVAAVAQLADGNTGEAERLLARGLHITRLSMQRAAGYESERQRLMQMMLCRNMFDAWLSLPVTLRSEGSGLYPYVLAWKGATATRQWRDRRLVTEDMVPIDAELRQIGRRLALLTLHPPEGAGQDEWRRDLYKLNLRKDLLEQQRASYSADAGAAQRETEIADLRAALSPGMALIDFLQYTHMSPEKVGGVVKIQKQQRYLAFVLRPNRPVARIDLGPAAAIAEAVSKWRRKRGFRPDRGQTDWGAAVSNLIWPKLKPHVDDCDMLLISPDGVLSQVPWNALPGRAPDSYLIEDFAIALVPVPQLLPHVLAAGRAGETPAKTGSDSLLLVGNIDYNAPAEDAPQAQLTAARAPAPLPRAGVMEFARLPGTAVEVQALWTQFQRARPAGSARLLDQGAATEDAFWREAPRHRWLHIATHGFFAPPSVMAAISAQYRPGAQVPQEGVSLLQVGYVNGLALAGANVGPRQGITAPAGGDDAPHGDYTEMKFNSATPLADGILTAAELSTMDLRGMEMAVLSGCETGLGEVQEGEGALGMQRALQIAGVQTTVGSLWTVSDQKTNVLMQRFYSNLWEKKLPRLQALREAQLWLMRGGDKPATVGATQPQRLSPHYWAAFTLSGDWR